MACRWLSLGLFIIVAWSPLKGADDQGFTLCKWEAPSCIPIYNSNIGSDNLFNHDWYQLLLNNKVTSEDLLIIETAQVDSVFIYLKSKNSIPYKFGTKVHYSEKKYRDRNILLPLSEMTLLSDSIFIWIANKSNYNVSMVVKTKSAFKEDEVVFHLFLGFYTGIVFLFILFQVIVFTRFRIFNYNFYYLLYLLFTYTYFMTEFGFSGLYIWYEFPHLDEDISFLLILGSGAYLILFVYDFLKAGLPVFFKKIIKVICAILILTALSILTDLYSIKKVYPFVFYTVLSCVLVSFMLAFVMSLTGAVKKLDKSIYLVYSFAFLVFGAILKPLSYTGAIDANFITSFGAVFGHLLEVVIISTVMVNLGLSQIKMSEKLKLENLMLEKTALSAQISPHFIFNGLNSVQAYIMNNDKNGAMDFISKYAKVIRLSLNASHQQYISLADEISFLDTYLALEKVKREGNTEYEIEYNISESPQKILIPPMLIQPFVENALLHGLRKIPHEGYLHIKFSKINDNVIVEVSDNGVGIIQSTTNGTHVSIGSGLTQKRLELINRTKENVIVYSKLYPENKQFPGTKVTITIRTI